MSGDGEKREGEGKALRKYTWDEIKQHSSPESLWLVVHDKVYDVTAFLEEVSWAREAAGESVTVCACLPSCAASWRGGGPDGASR